MKFVVQQLGKCWEALNKEKCERAIGGKFSPRDSFFPSPHLRGPLIYTF
jgi:hypothetical protein